MKNYYRNLLTFLMLSYFFTSANYLNAQIVVSQSFDGAAFPPAGWTLTTVAGGGGPGGGNYWSRFTTGTFPTCLPYSGAGMARFNSRTSPNGATQSLITPAFDLSDLGSDTARIGFWIYRSDSSAAATPDYDTLNVMVNTLADTLGAVNIATIARDIRIALPDTQASAGWYYYSFDLPSSFNGTVNYLILRGTKRSASNSGYRIFVDDITYDTYPAPCSGLPVSGSVSVSDTLFCTSGEASLSLSGATSGIPGIQIQWQNSPSLGGPYVNFGADTTFISTGVLTSTTYFRCVVICLNTNDSAFSNEVMVRVDSAAPVILTVADDSVTYCTNSGVPAMLIASGAENYSWSPTQGLSSANTDTVFANPNFSITYTVVGTNSAGCSSSATVRVTASQNPNVSVTPATTTVCVGDSVTLTAVATIAGGGPGGGQQVAATFVWNPVGLTGNSIRIPVDSLTTIYAIGTTLAGCTGANSVDSAVINVVTTPVAGAISASDTVICGGPGTSQLNLTGASVGSFTWLYGSTATGPWTPNSTQGSSVTTDTITAPVYYICVVSCPNGASDTSDVQFVNISQGPAPSVVLSTTQAYYCQTSNPTLLVATGASFYLWTPGTGLNSTFTDTVYAAPLQSTTYLVTGYDSLGCSDTASVRVSVRTNPVVSVNPANSTICEGDSVTLTANANNVGIGGTMNYTWQPGGLIGNSITISPAVGITQYVVTGVSSFGCSNAGSIDTSNVTVDPAAVAGFSYSVSGPTVTFTNISVNAISYSWDFGDGSTSVLQSPVHSYANGVYNVVLIANGSCSSDTFTVQINISGVGVSEFDPFEASIVPNPAQDWVKVSFKGSPDLIQMFDITGHEITSVNPGNQSIGSITLDLSGVAPGVYYIRLQNDATASVFRFVRQ